MDDQELRQRFDALDKRIVDVYASAEKTRKYFLALLIITIVTLVLPLIGLFFAVPTFLSSYSDLSGL